MAYFNWVGPHGTLPTAATCAAEIPAGPSEIRPENTTANNTLATSEQLATFHAAPWNAASPPVSDFATVDGNYTGTTDQILRWAACKHGIDENYMRAQAWEESGWSAYDTGDLRIIQAICSAGDWNGWNSTYGYCFQSYGIIQSKAFDFNNMPMSWDSTAFNLDFRGANWRACINGDYTYLDGPAQTRGYPAYPGGTAIQMELGCLGTDLSGLWYDSTAIAYINTIAAFVAEVPSRSPSEKHHRLS